MGDFYENGDLSNLVILYVEDEEGARDNLLYYLKNSFKKVYSASNGLEGLEIFNKYYFDIDLVISDIQMPKLNGLEMVKKIRERDAEIPFLLTTAYGHQEYMLEAIELGVTSYIMKPIDISLLFEKIELAYKNIYKEENFKLITKKMSSLKNLDIQNFLSVLDRTIEEFSKQKRFYLVDGYVYNFDIKCIEKDEKTISLNKQEIKVMEYLIKNRTVVVSYQALINYLSPEHPSIDLLRTVIKSIRKKTDKKIIKNLSGIGYKIVEDV